MRGSTATAPTCQGLVAPVASAARLQAMPAAAEPHTLPCGMAPDLWPALMNALQRVVAGSIDKDASW